jgi:hypothetical protein
VSHEHAEAGLFDPGEVLGLVMPEGYKRSIADWFARLGGGVAGQDRAAVAVDAREDVDARGQ